MNRNREFFVTILFRPAERVKRKSAGQDSPLCLTKTVSSLPQTAPVTCNRANKY